MQSQKNAEQKKSGGSSFRESWRVAERVGLSKPAKEALDKVEMLQTKLEGAPHHPYPRSQLIRGRRLLASRILESACEAIMLSQDINAWAVQFTARPPGEPAKAEPAPTNVLVIPRAVFVSASRA